jgi:hypothetical protein
MSSNSLHCSFDISWHLRNFVINIFPHRSLRCNVFAGHYFIILYSLYFYELSFFFINESSIPNITLQSFQSIQKTVFNQVSIKSCRKLSIISKSWVILWAFYITGTRVHQNPWNLAIWFIIQYYMTRIFLFWPKKFFSQLYVILKNIGLMQKISLNHVIGAK